MPLVAASLPDGGPPGRWRIWYRRLRLPLVALLTLLIGIGIGNAGAGAAKLQTQLTASNKQVSRLNGEVKSLSGQVANLRSQQGTLQSQNGSLQSQVDGLTAQLQVAQAKRPLPSLMGQTEVDAQALADQYGWDLTVKTQGSAKPEGTIIAQDPRPGTVMKAGAHFTIVVAKALPPSWKTLYSWSGSGTFNSPMVNIPDGQVRLTYTFSGSDNDVIWLMDGPNSTVELFVNDIGPKSGSTNVYDSGRYFFSIEGGSWTVSLEVFK